LIEKPEFVRDYHTGTLAPEKILSFGKSHGIVINQFAIREVLPGKQ
jgi:hypothetical protein